MSTLTVEQRLDRIRDLLPKMRRHEAAMRGADGQAYRDAGTQEYVACSDQLFGLMSSLQVDGSLDLMIDALKEDDPLTTV